MYRAFGVRSTRTMPKSVRNCSASSRSGDCSLAKAMSVTLTTGMALPPESRNEPHGVLAADAVDLGGAQAEIGELLLLRPGGHVRKVAPVHHLRGRHELEKRRHGRRVCGVRRVVVQPPQLGGHALRREALEVLAKAREVIDAPGEHRHRAARMREEPLDVAVLRE